VASSVRGISGIVLLTTLGFLEGSVSDDGVRQIFSVVGGLVRKGLVSTFAQRACLLICNSLRILHYKGPAAYRRCLKEWDVTEMTVSGFADCARLRCHSMALRLQATRGDWGASEGCRRQAVDAANWSPSLTRSAKWKRKWSPRWNTARRPRGACETWNFGRVPDAV
jgi:hypothetical protein